MKIDRDKLKAENDAQNIVRPKLTKSEKIDDQEVIRLYVEEQLSLINVGKAFACSATVVKKILKKHNIPTRPKGGYRPYTRKTHREKYDVDAIIARYVDNKMSAAHISKIYGVTDQTIRNILKSAGVELRSHQESHHRNYREKYDVDHIIDLYVNQELSLVDTGKYVNLSGPTIADILKAEGIPTRDPQQAMLIVHKQKQNLREMHAPIAEQETITVQLEAGLGTIEVPKGASIQEMRDLGCPIDAIAEIAGISRVEVFNRLYRLKKS